MPIHKFIILFFCVSQNTLLKKFKKCDSSRTVHCCNTSLPETLCFSFCLFKGQSALIGQPLKSLFWKCNTLCHWVSAPEASAVNSFISMVLRRRYWKFMQWFLPSLKKNNNNKTASHHLHNYSLRVGQSRQQVGMQMLI